MLAIALYLRSDNLGRRNLEHAIQTGWWGFTRERDHYVHVTRGTVVLIATGFNHPTLGGSPRRSSDMWAEGSLRRIAVFRAESGVRREATLLRPDEIESGELRYPFRVDVKHIRDAHQVPISSLPNELTEAFRRSALSGGSGLLVDLQSLPRALTVDRL